MNAKPGNVTFSSSGRGTANHLAQVWFDERLRAKSAYNGFKGTAAAVAALIDERVDASWVFTTTGVKYSDKLRMLAVAMDKRPSFPMSRHSANSDTTTSAAPTVLRYQIQRRKTSK